jgi:hypothetical protein
VPRYFKPPHPKKPRKSKMQEEKPNSRSGFFYRELDIYHVRLDEQYDWGYEVFNFTMNSLEEAQQIVQDYKEGGSPPPEAKRSEYKKYKWE